MFDSQSQDPSHRPLKAVSVGHLARDGRWGLESQRSYLVPVLFWFTCGQGRISVNGEVRGFTAHNAIFLPANTPHACEANSRTQGTALFFGGHQHLPEPEDIVHLRVSSLQRQAEMNHLVDCFRQDCACELPMGDEILYHRAALILLWLSQQSLSGDASRTGPVRATERLLQQVYNRKS